MSDDFQVMKTAHREYQRLRGAVSRDPQLSNLPGLSQYQARIEAILLSSFSPFLLSVAVLQHALINDILQAQAASLAGHLTADALLFPLETVLHRLHLQALTDLDQLFLDQLLSHRAQGALLITWTPAGKLCPSSLDMRVWLTASPQSFR